MKKLNIYSEALFIIIFIFFYSQNINAQTYLIRELKGGIWVTSQVEITNSVQTNTNNNQPSSAKSPIKINSNVITSEEIERRGYKNAQEVVDFINSYDNSSFVWLALDTETGDQTAAGVSIYDAVRHELKDSFKKEYPSFYLDEEYTADMLQENVLSRLKVLIDHSDFIDLIKQSDLYYDTMAANKGIKQRYQNIKENGLQVIGIRGYVKKSDLLNMINSGEIYYGYVNDVKMSRLQRK